MEAGVKIDEEIVSRLAVPVGIDLRQHILALFLQYIGRAAVVVVDQECRPVEADFVRRLARDAGGGTGCLRSHRTAYQMFLPRVAGPPGVA